MARPDADARRRQILSAAETLFARRGFAGTSMADIVAASGVATGTVYRYFAGKDDLVLAVSDDSAGVAFATASGGDLTVEEAVDALMASALDRRTGRLDMQVWAHGIDSPALRERFRIRHLQICRWLAQAIEGTHGDPTDAGLALAEFAYCAIGGLADRLALDVEMVDLDGFRDRVIRVIRSGAQPPGA